MPFVSFVVNNNFMDVLIFDLDNTLYPAEKQLFSLIDVRINRYMIEIAGIPAPEVDALRRKYWRLYGVTLQGLIRHHEVDPEDYLLYVHDIDVTSRLAPDLVLRKTLANLPQRKAVFTNGSICHADRPQPSRKRGDFQFAQAVYSPRR